MPRIFFAFLVLIFIAGSVNAQQQLPTEEQFYQTLQPRPAGYWFSRTGAGTATATISSWRISDYVRVDVNQGATFSDNTYANDGSIIATNPFTQIGVPYADCAAWRAAVEPTANCEIP